MKLTVIGNCGPYPPKNGACSGYLLETEGAKILIECGSGVLSKLPNYCALEEITHIILSHLHYDHMGDIMVFKYAIEGKLKRGQKLNTIKLFLPNEPKDEFQKITSKDLFDVVIINDGLKTQINNLNISFARMNHPIPSYGVRIQEKEKVFVYSGDASYLNFPLEFVGDCDMFLCDSALLSSEKKTSDVSHLTSAEVGEIAKNARVKKLLITHFWPEANQEDNLKEAIGIFSHTEIAQIDKIYNI
ncbi:MAG: MBL fold metallo-hydrolase [Deltaproteobacteria bacterium]